MRHDQEAQSDEEQRFLIFSLGDQLYGAPLTTVREVIRTGQINAVPFMKPHFKGVMNLRGSIISVIDLRTKFQIPAKDGGLIITVDGGTDTVGAIVDDVVAVVVLQLGDLSRDVKTNALIASEFFVGVAKHKDRLVNIIDIGKALDTEDHAAISRTRGESRKSA